MAKTRKLLARFVPVILVTSAAAHSAFAPLRNRAQAAVPSAPKAKPTSDEKSADHKTASSASIVSPIAGIFAGISDSKLPPLQTRLDSPVARTLLPTLLDLPPASTINLLDTGGLGVPTSPYKFEPLLPAPITKSEPVNLDPGGGRSVATNPTDVGRIGSASVTPSPVPEPIALIPLFTITTLLGRRRRNTAD